MVRYVYDATLLRAQICLTNDITIRVLTLVNPSLCAATCDVDLACATAYCALPLFDLKPMDTPTPSSSSSTCSTFYLYFPGVFFPCQRSPYCISQ